jgi:hypothetical protein
VSAAERYTVTLTAEGLAALRRAGEIAFVNDEHLAALNAAKPVRATKPRATPAAVEPFSPNTGNPAVDDFMRRKHNPKYKPRPLPKSPGLPPLRPMKVSEQDAAEAAWKSACDGARATVADGKPSAAERELRALIAIHRNPWALEAIDGPARIFTSPRHPGVAIHEVHERGTFGSGFAVNASTTWRVAAGGEFSEKVHYAARAAEIEADDLVLALT